MASLTRRQEAVYRYLCEHAREHPPTLDEVCRGLGLRSRGSLHKHIQALIQAGLVEPRSGAHRGIRLTNPRARAAHDLPLLGKVAAGRPLEPFEAPETIEVPEILLGRGPCYVLQVSGDSMIEAGLLDGDWIVVEHTTRADNHQVVVALVEGRETTLKRIVQSPGKVILYPANRALEPLVYAPEQIEIQGVVVGQMRRYG